MSIAGFFILLAIAILLRIIGNKLVPVVMPSGRIKTIGLGWLGGFLGSLLDGALWQFGPEVAEINLVAATIGCALFILLFGLFPFIRILLRRA